MGATIWERIEREKKCFIEPKGKQEFGQIIAAFEKEINLGKGAVFYAVCRGKASEGLDFSDKKGRAVVICGIPYPHAKDARVNLKKKILDEGSSSLSGNEWYKQQASRAVNQAIGRVYIFFI